MINNKKKCLLICDEGFEKTVAKTLETKYPKIKLVSISPTSIIFLADTNKQIAEICYTFQGAIKIISNLITFNADSNFTKTKEYFENSLSESTFIDDISGIVKDINFLKISCIRKGYHDFKSVDFSSIISEKIFPDVKRNLRNPDLELLAYIKDDKGYFGIDFAGRILSKRDHKIFSGANTLRSTVGYNLLKVSNYSETDLLIDPFMGSGTIVIEAALELTKTPVFMFSKEKFAFTKFLKGEKWDEWFKEIDQKRELKLKNIYGYDSLLKFLKYSQKNAKIADINKSLNLSKVSVDWLDTKFDENSINKIVTNPPLLTEHGSKTKITKIYKDLFSQANILLHIKGTLTIITNERSAEQILRLAEENSFKKIEDLDVFEGKQEFRVLSFSK